MAAQSGVAGSLRWEKTVSLAVKWVSLVTLLLVMAPKFKDSRG